MKKGEEKINVLLVEDSISLLNSIKRIISNDANVYTARDGKEALEIFKKHKIDAIFSDIYMPYMNGIELLKEVRKKDENLPFVLFTQFKDLDSVSEAIELGITAFLPKPFTKEKLLKTFEKIKELYNLKKEKDIKVILEQYKKAIDASTIVSKTNPNGIITYVNDMFCKISGYSKDELIGKSHKIVRDPDVSKEVFEEMWNTIKAKKIWRGNLSNRAKDGSKYVVKTTIVPILDKNGEIKEYITFREDITEIIKKDEKLKAERKKLYKILDNMDNILGLLDKNKKLTFVNKPFFEMFGFKDLKDFLKKYDSIADLFIKEEGYLQKYIDGKPWLDYVMEHPHKIHKILMVDKNGTKHIFSLKAKELKDDEVFYLFTLNDITEIDELRKKAEELSQAKSLFLANMSHEIRTPMNAILGFTQLLEKTTSPEKQKQYLEIINKSATTLLEIINDILDFSKLQSGKMELDITEENPFKEFAKIVMLFIARAKEKNITLETDIDLNIPECLKFDSVKIQQVLSNLIGNAIKFTPKGGKIIVYAKLIEKKGDKAKLKIGVRDTGIGISKEAQKKIFDAFSQADSSTTRKFGGTGLGLAISSKLVKLMGGELKVKSEEGKGSDFFFEAEFEICKPKHSIKELFKSFNIIVVCDKKTDLVEKVLKYLKTLGIKCIVVSLKDATQYLKHNNIFILFCNYDKLLNDLIKKDIAAIIICDKVDGEIEDVNIKVIKEMDSISILYNDLLEIGLLKNSIEDKKEYDNKSYIGKVLVAEDNEVNQILIKELLSQYNIYPVIVENGKKAVEEELKNKYDLILMDVSMPEMNGIDAMKILKQKGVKTPIIALTANAMEGDKEKFLKEGFDGYLSKPIEIKNLEKILDKYLGIKAKKGITKEEKSEEKFVDFDLIKKELPLPDGLLFNVFRAFLSSYSNIMRELKEGIDKRDFDKIYRASHKLKGAAANIRLKKVAEIAGKISDAAKEKKEIDYKTLFNKLKEVLEKVREELEKIMK